MKLIQKKKQGKIKNKQQHIKNIKLKKLMTFFMLFIPFLIPDRLSSLIGVNPTTITNIIAKTFLYEQS